MWARTSATERGRGGKAVPLNPLEDGTGSYAVRNVGDQYRAVLVARPLGKDDVVDQVSEWRAMPHMATCQPRLPAPAGGDLPSNVVPMRQN